MKALCLLIALCLLSGCAPGLDQPGVGVLHYGGCSQKIRTVEYDGCEYLLMAEGGQGQCLTHKGNCKYCLARQAK